jgi:hypothetical protein
VAIFDLPPRRKIVVLFVLARCAPAIDSTPRRNMFAYHSLSLGLFWLDKGVEKALAM